MTTLEQVWRDHWGRLLALLVGELRDLDLAEDVLGDAFEAAARTWPEAGVPANPPAWLLTVARRRATDRRRAQATARRRLPLLGLPTTDVHGRRHLAGRCVIRPWAPTREG